MIRIESEGTFSRFKKWAKSIVEPDIFANFDTYGRMGVEALRANTPVDTGLTAASWDYRIVRDRKRPGIEWFNTNHIYGTPVVILLQYGHGTGTGGYVVGRDFINPAIEPVFITIANDFWREVTS